MFKVIPNDTDRLDIEMSGKLNAEEMKVALGELVSKLERRSGKKANIEGISNQNSTGSIRSCMTADILIPNDGSNCLKSGF
jgi:hypothetical protein